MPLPRCPMRTEEEGATGGGGPPGSAGHTERQLPAPPAGLRVWTVSSALICVLFPGVSVLPPQALTRLPPLPSGTCLAAPPLHLVAHRGAVLIAPDLSCRAPPLPCGLGVLSPSRWPSTSSGSITGPSAWPIPRRDCSGPEPRAQRSSTSSVWAVPEPSGAVTRRRGAEPRG